MIEFELKQEVFDSLKNICFERFDKGEDIPVNRAFDMLMELKDLPMHCPYHHFILPAAMLTISAIKDKNTKGELAEQLDIAEQRARTVPAGFCGVCGTCGSGVGMGIFVAVYTGATPKSVETWQIANETTGRSLLKIAEYPGPRCCKRTSYLAAIGAVPYINDKLDMEFSIDEEIKCKFNKYNAECLRENCPFFEENN